MGAALLIAFLVIPIVEIYVIIQVGQAIGALPTVLLLVIESLLGAWLVRREGARAWRGLRAVVVAGRLPSRELADASLVLVGGTLLLTPGFVTDVAGFFLVLPFTRPLARRMLVGYLARRTVVRRWPQGGRGTGRVVPGEVVPGDRSEGTPDESGPGRATGG